MNPTETPERWQEDEARWAAWMRRAQRGDRGAYEQLLTELGGVIEAYVGARFGSIDGLEDCVQECLLALHRARHTYNPRRPFRPWLFTLVRHRTIDVLRRRSTSDRGADARSAPPASVEADELDRRLDGIRVLERLAGDQRDAIALTQYAGYTAAEAAARLGISEAAVKARLRRALAVVRRALEREDTGT
ncbi:MAG: RNA polymerase sigma factor [Gammaproteobacteria bacterium]